MEKLPSKVAHNRPPTFFFSTGPAAQTAQKQKSCTTKSPLMQDWVFRLGHSLIFKRSHRVWNKNNIILPTYVLLSCNKVNIVLHFTFYMFSTLLIGALGPHHAYLFTQIIQIPEYLKRGC